MEKEDNRRVWLGITYTVPAKPSRARVYIWRKLKELGAEYYHGMAMVPQTPRLQESIKKLVARIRELGAEVSVLEIRFADPADEEKVVAQFRRQAENDFRELFLDFARLYEELGGPLDGDEDQRRILRRRYGKVKSRDFFHVAEEPDFSAGLSATRTTPEAAGPKQARPVPGDPPFRGLPPAAGRHPAFHRGAVPAVCGPLFGEIGRLFWRGAGWPRLDFPAGAVYNCITS